MFSKFFSSISKQVKLSAIVTSIAAASCVEADALIDSCDECHGKNGVSVIAEVPTIAGFSAYSLELLLESYTDGSRKAREYEGKDMQTIVEALSEAESKKVIDHYAAQTFEAAKQPFDASQVAKGKSLHEQYCIKCHSEGGSLAEDDAGIIAGQWQAYLLEELKQYKTGGRLGTEKMIKDLKTMNEDQFKALVAFYASQQ